MCKSSGPFSRVSVKRSKNVRDDLEPSNFRNSSCGKKAVATFFGGSYARLPALKQSLHEVQNETV